MKCLLKINYSFVMRGYRLQKYKETAQYTPAGRGLGTSPLVEYRRAVLHQITIISVPFLSRSSCTPPIILLSRWILSGICMSYSVVK